jgi:hypothetical protein
MIFVMDLENWRTCSAFSVAFVLSTFFKLFRNKILSTVIAAPIFQTQSFVCAFLRQRLGGGAILYAWSRNKVYL